jgi:DNA-binding NarL/FixJ family response regulator
VLFTAQDDADSRAFASAVGATAYLAKPFAPADLLRVLRLVEHQESAAAQRGDAANDRDTPAMEPYVSVVIADDHAGIRDGLRSAIGAEPGMGVAGVAIDGEDAIQQIRALRPDIAVLDNDMPKRTGLEVLEAIHAELPEVAIVMFTLDDSIRARAMALGARAVVTKDTPLYALISELRRAATSGPSRPASAGVVMAQSVARLASGVLQRRKRGFTVIAAMGVVYAAGFLILEPALGASASLLQLIPVAAAGAMFGPEVGIAAALLSAVITAILWQGTGHPLGEPILTIGGNGLGVLALVGLGAGFGVMRVLRGRLNPDARRAGALAEAAALLSAGGGPQLLRLLAKAALDVVPGDAALLFLPVPGGGLELVAGADVPSELLGSRHQGAALDRAHAGQRAAIVDAGASQVGVAVPRMRAAVVASVRDARGESRGVIVVLSARRAALRDAHIDALWAYGAFIGTAIAMTADVTTPLESRAGALRT